MQNIYTTGDYLAETQTWHSEDSPWKAQQILRLLRVNHLRPRTIAEIGCGAGQILQTLASDDDLRDTRFSGYDISPQAIDLCSRVDNPAIEFFCDDLLANETIQPADLLLVIDVIEHIPDYMGFLERCQRKAEHKVFHIPLDLHVSSVLRNAFIRNRYTIGHIHYFTAESALAALRDTGHEIIDYHFTSGTLDMFRLHPSIKRAAAFGPRWLLSRFSTAMTARLLGGFSLLVLTK